MVSIKDIIGKIGYTKYEKRMNLLLRNKIHKPKRYVIPDTNTKSFKRQLRKMKLWYLDRKL